MGHLLLVLDFRFNFRVRTYISIEIQPLKMQVIWNVNIYETTNLLDLVTAEPSYAGTTGVT